jgi:hypothetical protein
MKNVIWIATAVLLAGCARGGGIGLEAMLADSTCEQRGFRLGTSEYANCRAQIGYRQSMVNAEMQARLERQQAELTAQMNRRQNCSYNGTTIGGNTSGSMTCQ